MSARKIVTNSLTALWSWRAALADMAAPSFLALTWTFTSLAIPAEQRGAAPVLAMAVVAWLALPLVVNIHRAVLAGQPDRLGSAALVRIGRAEILVAIGLVLTVAPVAFALALLLVAGITHSVVGVVIALPEVVLLLIAAARLALTVTAGALGLWPPWRLAWAYSAFYFWSMARTLGLALAVAGVAIYAVNAGLAGVESWIAAPAAGRSMPPLAGIIVLAALKAAATTTALVFLCIVNARMGTGILASGPPPAPRPQADGGNTG